MVFFCNQNLLFRTLGVRYNLSVIVLILSFAFQNFFSQIVYSSKFELGVCLDPFSSCVLTIFSCCLSINLQINLKDSIFVVQTLGPLPAVKNLISTICTHNVHYNKIILYLFSSYCIIYYFTVMLWYIQFFLTLCLKFQFITPQT